MKYNITEKNEKKVYSQYGEDGIIEYIFSKIKTENKIAVEIGVHINECNTRNLLKNNWKLFWIDKNIKNEFKETTIINEFVTKDNILKIFENNNIPKDLDLLSIDMDGNDYHIRNCLKDYKPKLLIMEYNGCYDSKTEYVMPYNEDYFWKFDPKNPDTKKFNASLLSISKQQEELGYDLVYVTKEGVNAFFVRKDINVFNPKTVDEAWKVCCWFKDMIV